MASRDWKSGLLPEEVRLMRDLERQIRTLRSTVNGSRRQRERLAWLKAERARIQNRVTIRVKRRELQLAA